MSCDLGKVTEGLENELWRRWSDGKVGEWVELIVIVVAELIFQTFRHFTYVTAHSPTLPSLYLRNSPFSNPSVASSTSQLIFQPFFRFSYVTSSSLNSPGEPPMGGWAIVGRSIEHEDVKKISTPPLPRIDPDRSPHSQTSCRLSDLAHFIRGGSLYIFKINIKFE